ncbi:unnamed protein product [Didymodactylos carnosus]|uniref:PDZ domain-containing protein n=1 Tax=Didymodactylos carnosus TaxID=1234261 RepID=A0A814EC05_9BILA|nr:unnamed protein product [Didymodactylos carnosus]CAF0967452.1 unnamed protein product [Didymodactylos carnosus]CAF3618248.1 unnamed protein product [Didymodactylos carnosus]CAF3740840.1 unnamed protein product [Didymodactylos carnosus]
MPATNEELIVYTDSRNGLGIRIIGAKKPTKHSGIFIKQLLEDGLAQKDGRLKVSDQIISINDESATGITRERAAHLLRSAAASNQVRLLIRHGNQSEYQKLLYDEKSTDDENYHQQQRHRRHHHHHHHNNRNIQYNNNREQQPKPQRRTRHRASKHHVADEDQDSDIEQIDLSKYALNSLLNSRFKLQDLLDLLKKSYDIDRNQENELSSHFTSLSLSEGRISLREFEHQASLILNEDINLLLPFYSTSNDSTSSPLIQDFRFQISECHQTIKELQQKVLTCEKTQRLSQEIELEYEDLLKYLYDQIKQYKLSEMKYDRKLQSQDAFIQKLFSYIPQGSQDLQQLKYEYQQIKLQGSPTKSSSSTTTATIMTTSPTLHKQRYSQYYTGGEIEKI